MTRESVELDSDVDSVMERIRLSMEKGSNLLNLSRLNLSSIPKIIEAHDNFKRVDLSHNNLSVLPDDLSGFGFVAVLDLSNNQFTEIPNGIKKLPQLLDLDLSGNKIEKTGSFVDAFVGIRSLDLSDNVLVELDSSISELSLLQKLGLSQNKLEQLPESLGDLSELGILSVRKNFLDKFPLNLSKLDKLESLDLEDNLLLEVPSAIRNFKKLRMLDVSSNKVTEIPSWLSELTELEGLYLWDNNIEIIPETLCSLSQIGTLSLAKNPIQFLPKRFGSLRALKHLFLFNTRISELPASFAELSNLKRASLSQNEIKAFPSQLCEIAHLEEIIIFGNLITEVPENIGNLSHLRILDLHDNNIKGFPAALSRLEGLQRLNLAQNSVTAIPDLRKLSNLDYLDASYNEIAVLPEWIGELSNLEYLDISQNLLSDLPEGLLGLKKLEILNLHNNTLLRLPSELIGERNTGNVYRRAVAKESPQSILSYYFARRSGTRPLNEMKIVVVGRGAAGKTSLLKRLIRKTYDPNEAETPGIEISNWTINLESKEKVRLHAWDFGGQEILHATHQFFFSERCLYLLVLTGRDGQQQNDAEYWLQLIGSFGGESDVIIVLNKADQHRFDLNRQTLFDKYPGRIYAFCETDCATDLGIDDLRQVIKSNVEKSEHRRIPFPAVWFSIKEELAKIKADYFSWEKFSQLCKEKGEFDDEQQHVLAGYLHALGIALNYSRDSRLADTHVLNPRWVTEGVYTLLRNGQCINEASIKVGALSEILHPKRYPKSKHDFLLRLMELYQLCFRLPNDDGSYLIPELLPRNQPLISEFISSADLQFYYSYSVLPEGVLPRFIVQTHSLSEGCLRWRSGVQLRWDGCEAVVIADGVDRLVKIYIVGPLYRGREFLAIIRQKFDEQHGYLKGVAVAEKIPLKNFSGYLLDYRDLLKREARKEESFYPENMDYPVNVRELLDGIELPAVREVRNQVNAENQSSNAQFVYQFFDTEIKHFNGGSMSKDESGKIVQNINGGVFNGSSIATNVGVMNWQSTLSNAPDSEVRQKLADLSNLVEQLIRQLPEDAAISASRNMTIFTEQALSTKPDVDYLMLAAKRLGSAASAVTAFANPILESVEKVIGLVT